MTNNLDIAQDKANELNEEQLSLELFETEENLQKTSNLIQTMITEYGEKPEEITLDTWLKSQYNKYIEAEVVEEAEIIEVLDIVEKIDENYTQLSENEEKEIPQSQWLAKKIQEGALAANITDIASYANSIDNSIINANEQAFKTFTNIDGSINLNPNLHGFVAEAHHVNTFNLEAASNASQYHARMLEGNGKNSVDIVIDDLASGNIAKRYQSKYGYESEATASYLKDGDYRGQRKLVPDGQECDIQGATNIIKSPDGTASKPLSYEDAQAIKAQIQVKEEISQYKWESLDKINLGKSIIAESAKMVVFHALFQGGRIFGGRIIKGIQGKKQNKIEEDMKDWLSSSYVGTKNIAIQSIITTAILISARNGWIKALQHTPAGKIASIVYIGVQNAKILYQIGQGKLTPLDGLHEMQKTTLSAVGGLIGAGKGALIGGSVGGPVGAIVGGIIGGIAGSSAGEIMSAGLNKIKPTLKNVIKKSYSIAKTAVKSYLKRLNPFNPIYM